MLNQIILVGRLTHDISVHKSEKGNKVATISLAKAAVVQPKIDIAKMNLNNILVNIINIRCNV